MSRDSTTGVYTAPSNSVNPAVSGTVINSTHFNAMLDDIETALSTAAATTRALWTRAAEVQDGAIWDAGTFGGSANALTCTLSPAPTAYTRGMTIIGLAASANTASTTLNANSIGANTVKKIMAGGKVNLAGGEWGTGDLLIFKSDGTNLVLINKIECQQGADIASATTTDLSAATGEYVRVTGTTTITGFGTARAGVVRYVTFTGILTLTNNATSLILPGAANITTAAGDNLLAVSLGSGNWRVLFYSPAATAPGGGLNLMTIMALGGV